MMMNFKNPMEYPDCEKNSVMGPIDQQPNKDQT